MTRRHSWQLIDVADVPDFTARLADAWDGRGANVLTHAEQRALWELAGMSAESLPREPWTGLRPMQREALIFAGRKAIAFGKTVAWCFGEGPGA